MPDDEEEWDLSREAAHPRAVELLKGEYFWDITDENSPFGNDSGWDTLMFYHDWRQEHPDGDPSEFLDRLLESWEVKNRDWDVTDPDEIQRLLDEDEFSFSTRDEAILALAFGQLVEEGRISEVVKRKALRAVERQLTPLLLKGWVDLVLDERISRLEEMRSILLLT